MRKSIFTLIIIQSGLMLSGLVFIPFSNKDILFDFSVMDVSVLMTSGITGIFITYIVSVAFPKKVKETDIIQEALSVYQSNIEIITDYLINNSNRKITKNIRSYVLAIAKVAYKDLDLLNNSLRKYEKNKVLKALFDRLKTEHMQFNNRVSGDYLIESNIIEEDYIDSCMCAFSVIKQIIFQIKIELVSST